MNERTFIISRACCQVPSMTSSVYAGCLAGCCARFPRLQSSNTVSGCITSPSGGAEPGSTSGMGLKYSRHQRSPILMLWVALIRRRQANLVQCDRVCRVHGRSGLSVTAHSCSCPIAAGRVCIMTPAGSHQLWCLHGCYEDIAHLARGTAHTAGIGQLLPPQPPHPAKACCQPAEAITFTRDAAAF